MVSLDRFDVFRAVVEAGSFTGAANVLNQARAAVSFNVKQLEAELGVTLLTRTTRRVALTEAGERFYKRCLRVLAEAEEAIDEARGEHGGMRGSLRVTSTVEYALKVVAPALREFTSQHPALRVRLETHTSQADLVRDRFDVAIRLGRFEQFQDLPYRGVCLDTYDVRPVVSPALLAERGVVRIESPDALARLPQLGHSRLSQVASWLLRDREGREHVFRPAAKPQMVADNASVLRAFAQQGSGVALLPEWLVRDDLDNGTLIDALPDYRFPPQSVYALYPSTRHVPQKIRAWIDFMKRYVRRRAEG
ncbi:LysR family transcriptional regulator [Burkholderia oklahomensis]|uniref:LysR family transcriptional regulator n=1 Tax=Burkholderia oklahomensis TaxID=342113 RepID=UPI00016AA25C|nr:LysR family transcriptional regulator [Burkholderia oklahomensis]AJX34689.1 bacterial regulatory helix-turn-helix, lysR family protein [Burkholderia oklahomensis C6786]AOI48577.1 LysR family transcriptional regulator [Burkholderia oklahomensis C6786]KUY47365.1 LysR family transcriptional regulator [Burkholderia oklahomensis C6786]MBI0363250.1 LysR family transcriptional regulator [Burkholderia oklahomensis]SUY27361.1 D-malate degradation protein R [Burkholderia oklahomensis]